MKWKWEWLSRLGFAFLLYLGLANVVYAVRHPTLTDTQRLLNFFDVLLFR